MEKLSLMTIIHLIGRITDSGKLEVELPTDLPPGEVQVTIESVSDEDAPISPEELDHYMHHTKARTGKEIAESGLLGIWKQKGITDSQAWVEKQRRKRSDQIRW